MGIKNSTIIKNVINQIQRDFDSGDLTAIEELLKKVPYDNLISFLPEENLIVTLYYKIEIETSDFGENHLVKVYHIVNNELKLLFEFEKGLFSINDDIEMELENNPPTEYPEGTTFVFEKI